MNAGARFVFICMVVMALGVVLWATVEWLADRVRTRHLARMAAAERAARDAEIKRARIVNFPQPHGELPAGIVPPSSARKEPS